MCVRRLRVGLLVVLSAVAGLAAVAGPPAWGDSCPNAVFRSGPSASLPDCRAYELVTPPFENGLFPFTPQSLNLNSSLDGANLTFSSLGAFGEPGANAGSGGSMYAAVRTAAGWVSTAIDPPGALFQNSKNLGTPFKDTSSDFSRSLFREAPASSKRFDRRIYLRQPGGEVVEVGPFGAPAAVAAATEQGPSETYVGASSDLSHVLFTLAYRHLTAFPFPFWPGDTTVQQESVTSLYEYVGTGNSTPILVGVDETGQLISQCGTNLGSTGQFEGSAYNAISSDGSTVFFTAAQGGCGGSGPPANEIFARIDQTHTVAISEPTAGDCAACDTGSPANAVFEGASREGSKAFFLTSQALLGTDTTQNLYEYDFNAPAGQRLTRISAGDPTAADVLGVARVSEDGSHVYFVARGVLTTLANSQGQTAQPGNDNLYVSEPDPARPGRLRTMFVAALAGADSSDWRQVDAGRLAQATPDGRFLLFPSRNDLTPDASGSGRQLYRYDAQTGDLVRVSIGEGGFNDNGNNGDSSSFRAVSYFSAFAAPPGVSISDDGSYVFFESTAALTPLALNEACIREEEGECLLRASNIYEYHEEHVYLISDGRDRQLVLGSGAVRLLGASSSGSDVFFSTADSLVPQDGNGQMDFYDARIDGGFPSGRGAPSCQGEDCQPLSTQPPALTPGSVTFSGPGNPAPMHATSRSKPKRCGAGRTPRHGRCVKTKRSKSKHAKRAQRASRRSNGGIVR